MYDIDLFENDAAVVAELHRLGRRAVCYMSAGSWAKWRPDAKEFHTEVRGATLAGWEDERWLDVLGPIMEARMDLCRSKGFDGIEPNSADGYHNDSGFPLTPEDQLAYNLLLAEMAHERGLSIGLKNDMDQIPDLLAHFDWALNEQCFQFDECDTLRPFIEASKAVFHVEYELDAGEFCTRANALDFSSLKKNLDLDSWREPCAKPGLATKGFP